MSKRIQPREQAVEAIVSAVKQKLEGHKGPLLVVLDGRSGTGKTTLSQVVGKQFNSTVILQDDFYAGGKIEEWAKMTAKEKVDHVIDWKRVRAEILEPLLSGRSATWYPFNWDTEVGLAEHSITAKPADIIILDGAFSSRPELSDLIDLSVLVQAGDNLRRSRLKVREGEEFMDVWHPVYDEAEDYYFSEVRPPSAFDLIVNAD